MRAGVPGPSHSRAQPWLDGEGGSCGPRGGGDCQSLTCSSYNLKKRPCPRPASREWGGGGENDQGDKLRPSGSLRMEGKGRFATSHRPEWERGWSPLLPWGAAGAHG